ncbi:MAG: 4Fe-4S binding protein [Synergistaceae bacterium]|nr:4Fe-4S binding protein [Synergistaceae bacterium]
MNKPQCWQDVPPGTVAWGASALNVETGLWRSVRPLLDLKKCVSCLKCWAQCPDMSVQTDGEGKICGIDLFFCKGCGICAEICPVKAISMHPESDFTGEAVRHGEDPGAVADHVG